jgi:hypothetical protein
MMKGIVIRALMIPDKVADRDTTLSIKNEECRNAGMQECRNAGMQECRNAGMQECRNAGMLECRNAGMQELGMRPACRR